MPRRRHLRPSFWESRTATSIGAGSRLLLLGCWTLADDEGLLLWDAATLRELIFPADRDITDEHVTSWMHDLVGNNIVLRYRGSDRVSYGYILGFERDQRVERPKASKLPAPNPRNLSVQKAYLIRDNYTCHLCDGPIPMPGTYEDTDRPDPGLEVAVDETASTDKSRAGIPSTVRVAHTACARLRAGRPVAAARQDPQVVQVAAAARAWAERDPAAGHPETDTGDSVSEQAPQSDPEPQPEPTDSSRTAPVTVGEPAQTSAPDLSPADVLLDEDEPATPSQHAGGDPMSVEDQDSLFVVPVEMVQEPEDPTGEPEPENWTEERKARAHAILKPWWTTYGADWPQNYRTIFKAVMSALCKNASQKHVKERLDALGEAGEHITNAALAPPKRKDPEGWTPTRKQQAHDLLKPWWNVYGEGWPQSYGVVFSVIMRCLSNKMSEDDIKRALMELGPQRKPVSGGTIGFALSKSTKQVAEQSAYDALAASRSADKYTQRTM